VSLGSPAVSGDSPGGSWQKEADKRSGFTSISGRGLSSVDGHTRVRENQCDFSITARGKGAGVGFEFSFLGRRM